MKKLKSPFEVDVIKIIHMPLQQAHGEIISKVLEYASWTLDSALCIMIVKNKTIHGLIFFVVLPHYSTQTCELVQNSKNIPASITLDTVPYVQNNIPLGISMTLARGIMHGYLWADKEADIKKEYLRIAMS